MSSVSQQGLCTSHAQQTAWNTPPSVLTLMFCIFTHLSVYRNPGVLFFFFSWRCLIWYFFVHLLTSAFSSISHGLKAVGAAFPIMCCSRAQWYSVWGESVQTFTVDWGVRFHQRPPLSHRLGTILNEAYICWFTISAIGRADCRLTENVQNIKQWVRMRLFINGANVRIMHRFLSNSSHLNAKPSKWSQWRKKIVPSDSLFPQSAAKPKVNLMNMELSSISGLHVLFSNCTLP